MSIGGRLSSAYLLGRTNNRFSRAYTRVCIRSCFFGVCMDACIRRDPFVTSGQVYVFVCTRGHRCFEQWKHHSRTKERGYRTLCSRPPLSNWEELSKHCSFAILFEIGCCYGGEKIVSKFDGFVIGGKVVQVRFFTDDRLGKKDSYVSFGGKLVRVFFINSNSCSSSTKISMKMKISCIRFLLSSKIIKNQSN